MGRSRRLLSVVLGREGSKSLSHVVSDPVFNLKPYNVFETQCIRNRYTPFSRVAGLVVG